MAGAYRDLLLPCCSSLLCEPAELSAAGAAEALDAEALPQRTGPRAGLAGQAVEHVLGHGPAGQCPQDLAAVLCVGGAVRSHGRAVGDAEMCRLLQLDIKTIILQ